VGKGRDWDRGDGDGVPKRARGGGLEGCQIKGKPKEGGKLGHAYGFSGCWEGCRERERGDY